MSKRNYWKLEAEDGIEPRRQAYEAYLGASALKHPHNWSRSRSVNPVQQHPSCCSCTLNYLAKLVDRVRFELT